MNLVLSAIKLAGAGDFEWRGGARCADKTGYRPPLLEKLAADVCCAQSPWWFFRKTGGQHERILLCLSKYR